jgi:Spy/CpxP family protein refolding chaperone
MKRGWFVLLALSLGLNAGLLYTSLAPRPDGVPAPPVVEHPGPAPEAPGDGQPGPPPAEQLVHGRHTRMCRFLGLDEQQREAMKAILQASLPRIVNLRAAVAEARQRILVAYHQPEVDVQQVRELVGALNATQAELDSLVAETMLQEVALLSPEQRQAYWRALPLALPDEHRGHGRRGLWRGGH